MFDDEVFCYWPLQGSQDTADLQEIGKKLGSKLGVIEHCFCPVINIENLNSLFLRVVG